MSVLTTKFMAVEGYINLKHSKKYFECTFYSKSSLVFSASNRIHLRKLNKVHYLKFDNKVYSIIIDYLGNKVLQWKFYSLLILHRLKLWETCMEYVMYV